MTQPGPQPFAHLAPFPDMPPRTVALHDGRNVLLRPLIPADEPLVVEFHRQLSDATVHWRFFHAMTLEQRTDHQRLVAVCHGDQARDFALAAECDGRIVAIARLARAHAGLVAELAVVVADAWQGRGLGSRLVAALLAEARAAGVIRVVMEILPDNDGMQRLARRHGFTCFHDQEEGVVRAELELGPPGAG
jgi:acetyltransferase